MIRPLLAAVVLAVWMPVVAVALGHLQTEQQLAAIGIDPGAIDGTPDARSRFAILQFQYTYGFDADGPLTADAVTLLGELARFASVQEPFKLVHKSDRVQTTAQLFQGSLDVVGPEVIYANGLHFLARYRPERYNTSNFRRDEALIKRLKDARDARSAYLWEAAEQLATSRGDVFGAALVPLTRYTYDLDGDGTETIARTLPAFEVMVALAEQTPRNTDYLSALTTAMVVRINHRKLCRTPEGKVFFPLLDRAVQAGLASGVDPLLWMAITRGALDCAPDARKDGFHQAVVSIAGRVSEKSVYESRAIWARDAKRRGAQDQARDQFRQVATWYLQGKAWEQKPYTDIVNGLMETSDVQAMHQLGMLQEAAALSTQRVNHITSIPSSTVGQSSAEQGNYSYALNTSALLFIETGQFEHLRKLGQFMVDEGQFRGYGRDRSNNPSGRVNAWDAAVTAIHSVFFRDDFDRTIALSAAVLPVMIREGAVDQALEISLLQAEAAVELGAFEVAEPALVSAASLSSQASQSDQTHQRIQDVRRALNLSQLEGLSAAEKIISQLDARYSELCGPNVDTQDGYYTFPDIDFEALGDDPKVAQALRDADIMNRILSCGISRNVGVIEARLICALAGLSGRRDVVDYFINGEIAGVKDWERHTGIETCAHGLADVGKFDWFRVKAPPGRETIQARNIRFLALDATQRQAVVAAANKEELGDEWTWLDFEIRHLEMPMDQPDRERLFKAFQRSFTSSFGRIGPQDSDYRQATLNAVAYRRMGLFRAAEAHLYIGERVDPFGFGAEPEALLNAQLLLPYAVHNRLGYAKLYRAWGRPAQAYAAIGPLAEQAIKRLGSNTDPLPGTVEQWAKRLEDLFIAYLEIQFDGLPQGPNYPAIFAIQQYLQLAGSTASASVLEQRLNSASPDLARQYQDAQRALRAAMRDPQGQGAALPDLSLRLQAIEARLPQADAALKSHQIGVTRPLRAVMGQLRKDKAAMLVVTQLPDAVMLMMLDGQNASARKLALGADAAASTVTAFRRGIVDSTDALDLFDHRLASSLYADLIGWARPDGTVPDDLRLVLSGPLTTLPFAALKHAEGWLGATTTLRASPSVARGTAIRGRSAQTTGFIGLGDPNLTQGDVATRRALLGAAGALAELPETAAELAFMAIVFGGNPNTDVFTRGRATETQMQTLNAEDRLSRVAVLALATHGLLSRETGSLKSAGLVLSLPQGTAQDGILTAREIYDYRIGADLVVLSACNTGTPGAGEGLSDLASAFLYAGAGALMLTHWEIDSGAGVEVMKRVALAHRAGGQDDYAVSLRIATGEMLSDASQQKFHHPRFWASHFVLG